MKHKSHNFGDTNNLPFSKHGENWEIGTKVLTEDEKNEAFRGLMKGKTLFLTPYYGVWNKTYGFRLSDSA